MPVDTLPILNTESEMIPPFGVVRVVSIAEDPDDPTRIIASVSMPDRDNATDILVNGPTPVLPGEQGQATRSWPCPMAYQDETNDSSPEGKIWGVKAGQWKLDRSRTGFVVLGAVGGGVATMLPESANSGNLRVQNAAGTTVRQYACLRVSGLSPDNAVLTDDPYSMSARPVYQAGYIVTTSDLLVCMKEATADGEICEAVLHGEAVAIVQFANSGDSSHEWAGPDTGNNRLISQATPGPVRIVAKPTAGTYPGENLCAVLMNPTLPAYVPKHFKIKNGTGSTVTRYSTLKIDDTIPSGVSDPAALQAAPTYFGYTPTNATGAFAIVDEGDLANLATANATFFGETVANVYLVASTDGWAAPDPGYNRLRSQAGPGPVRILRYYYEVGSTIPGETLAAVLVNNSILDSRLTVRTSLSFATTATITNINDLRLEGEYWYYSAGAAGVVFVQITDADATHKGLMSAGEQYFGGKKHFEGIVSVGAGGTGGYSFRAADSTIELGPGDSGPIQAYLSQTELVFYAPPGSSGYLPFVMGIAGSAGTYHYLLGMNNGINPGTVGSTQMEFIHTVGILATWLGVNADVSGGVPVAGVTDTITKSGVTTYYGRGLYLGKSGTSTGLSGTY